MKVVCISDTHGKHEELTLPNGDVLIHAGDFTMNSSKLAVVTFLEWFNEQEYKHKVLIAGNHERQLESDPMWFQDLLARFPAITYLQNSGTTIEGLKFWGSPDTPEFCAWAFNRTHEELVEIWNQVPNDTEVLITHGPAHGILDKVNNTWSADSNLGCKALKECIKTLPSLKLHVSGHLHESAGIHERNYVAVNASVLDEGYKMVNKPIVINI